MSAPATCNATSLPERDRLREAELRILEWAEANAEDIERREVWAHAVKDWYADLTIGTRQSEVLKLLVREWQLEKIARGAA